MGDLPGGGGAAEVQPHSTPFAEPNGLEIGAEKWAAADRAAREITRKIQPTHHSEERRREVVDYIQRLIRECLGAEVFPYGSVPLKTYLPDGDIDLTAFGGANKEDKLANDMKSLLEEEEKNTAAEFVVKDVQLIRAEVKLVKCIVQDIVVDISFNQIGGLCTLCFLEQVDRLIGRDHLFKCSIILIKAWCYYESRILGAHHGLISTYALETLVLYIFHLYSSTLDGPFTVLYKFLDCFSKFDWDIYCVSLRGLVRLSSLPAIDVEIPEDSDKILLLSNDFMNSCVGTFSVPSRDGAFQAKHLNIVDPLKEVNNLGRSVSQGNFYRIRSAFSYGARKLGQILHQPQASIANELENFFANTMARHGGGKRSDVRDFDRSLISNRHVSMAPYPKAGFCRTDNFYEYSDQYEDVTTPAFECLRISGSHDENLLADKDDAVASSQHGYASWDQRSSSFSGDSTHVDTDHGRASRSGLAESLNSPDLTGDYESFIHHLQYGRWCYEYGLATQPMPVPPVPSPPYPWDGLLPVLHYKQNGFSHHHQNGFHPHPAIYGMQPVLIPAGPYAWEDVPKQRGTGTYLPNANMSHHGNRSPAMKVRNQALSRSPRHNGRNMTVQEPYILDRSSYEVVQPVDKTVVASSSDSYPTLPPHQNGNPNANDSIIQREGIELELAGHASGMPVSENSQPQRTVSSLPRTAVPGLQRPQTAPSKEQERISLRSSYILKDEDDFPPLST